MIPLIALVVGAAIGWYRSNKAGGETLDKLQYAAAHGIAFFLVALVIGTTWLRF